MKTKLSKKFRYVNRILSVLLIVCMMLATLSIAVYSAEDTTTQTDAADDVLTVGALEGNAENAEGAGNEGDISAPAEPATPDENLVEVVFATTNVLKGAKFTQNNTEVRMVHKDRVPSGAMTKLDSVIGKFAVIQINAGEYVYDDAISKTKAQETKANTTYINVADYVTPSSKKDVTKAIQDLIEKNPKRTLYFPDGEYLISRSLRTYGDPDKTVCLLLADGAVIKASSSWVSEKGCDCLIASGVYNSYNEEWSELGPLSDVVTIGSYFWIQGGTLDGNGKAGGISLDGGRETLVKGTVIKNVPLGIRVNKGVNNKSSDMDVDDVIIQCTGASGSMGMEVLGYDNTFTNIRIYNAHKGIVMPRYDHTSITGLVSTGVSSGGNAFRNIQIMRGTAPYSGSYGVHEDWHANFFYHCYIENYATGMRIRGVGNIIDSCSFQWTKNEGTRYAFTSLSSMGDTLSVCRITSGVTINSASGSGWSDKLIRN